MRSLHAGIVSDVVLREEREVEGLLCELLEREEIMARQRSRVDWLWEGDHNTAFFHARSNARRKTNRIKVVVREDGSKCVNLQGIKGMIVDFFGHLFTSEPSLSMAEVLGAILVKVNEQMNTELSKPYLDEEIHDALFQMVPTKAPGPDGFPALFYQTHWKFLRDDICDAFAAS